MLEASHAGNASSLTWQALAEALPGIRFEHVTEIDSTNSELMRRARSHLLESVFLVSERQTAGRGRFGRSWHTAAAGGSTLTFSLGLPVSRTDLSGLSLAVGVAIAASLHPALHLKWPNDIWLNERKLAGVLIETAIVNQTRYVVIGVGVNLAQPDLAGLPTPPAWLQELMPNINPVQTLQRIAAPLLESVELFSAQGFAAFRSDFERLDLLKGRAVSLSDGVQGIAQGVDARGALLVHTSEGERVIESAQLSVRPVN